MMLHPTQELEPPANPARFKATVESSDEEIASSIPMLLVLHEIAEGGSELGEDAVRELDAMAPDVIPDLVANLNAWVKAQGRTKGPANLPGVAAARAKVGRNDPCPCGSGKKFKKCCGAETIH
ncbi:MAG: SEC-C metal-binding domain-containing protein [Tabrizicola sp.]